MAGRPACVYCGAPLMGRERLPQAPEVPPEILLAAEARAFRMPPGVRQGLRWGAIAVAGALAWWLSSGS